MGSGDEEVAALDLARLSLPDAVDELLVVVDEEVEVVVHELAATFES